MRRKKRGQEARQRFAKETALVIGFKRNERIYETEVSQKKRNKRLSEAWDELYTGGGCTEREEYFCRLTMGRRRHRRRPRRRIVVGTFPSQWDGVTKEL